MYLDKAYFSQPYLTKWLTFKIETGFNKKFTLSLLGFNQPGLPGGRIHHPCSFESPGSQIWSDCSAYDAIGLPS